MSFARYESLDIYNLSRKLSRLIWNEASQWDNFCKDTVGKQIVKSADSIGANIAEGSGKGNSLDYIRFLKISRGSLFETKHWADLAFERKLLSSEHKEDIESIIGELSPKLSSYINYIVSKIK